MTKKDALQLSPTGGDVVRNFFNIGRVKKIFRLGSDVVSALTPVLERQTPLTVAQAVFSIGKIVVDDLEVWPDDYFDSTWESPYPAGFNRTVLKALSGRPYKVIKTSDEFVVIHMVHFDDVVFGYVINIKTNFVDRICVKLDKLEQARELIKNELWRLMRGQNIVLRRPRTKGRDDGNEPVSLDVDDAFQPMPSRRADEYSAYLKKCIESGVSRSVLLYGPPGTGKSTMARTIVSNLGFKSFRIRVEDIGHIDTSDVFEAISMFEPDAVILDDFDRTSAQDSLLEVLEFFQRHVKLVIATVNNKNHLDEAILRPGRFDELVQIKQMDEDVVKVVLGDEHAASLELVRDWPIAFIQEYVKRLRFMSPTEAQQTVKELAHRVQRLSMYDDEDAGIDRVVSPDREGTGPGIDLGEILGRSIKKTRRKKRT